MRLPGLDQTTCFSTAADYETLSLCNQRESSLVQVLATREQQPTATTGHWPLLLLSTVLYFSAASRVHGLAPCSTSYRPPFRISHSEIDNLKQYFIFS